MQPPAQAHFYDQVWTANHVWNPRVWPEWDVILPILENCPRRLEIGPGTRPRLPISGSWFVDVSQVALSKLQGHGCNGILANANALPFPDCRFDLVASCELLEHIEDDERAVAELARVTSIGGFLLLSVPLQPALWTAHDTLVGHFRRYEPAALANLITVNGYEIIGFWPQPVGGQQYGIFKRFGAWLLTCAPNLAFWLEDRITLPIGVRLYRLVRRKLPESLVETYAPGGTLLCRRTSAICE